MNHILIATGNKHKKEKLTWIVNNHFDKIDYLEDLDFSINIDENASTFEGNAQLKALTYSKKYDGFVIATDGGVSIPALESWNNLRTKRFAGEDISDFQRIDILLEMMKDKKGKDRAMVWNEAIAIAKDGKVLFSTEVEGVKGLMETEFNPANYKEGIWVCSIWFFPQFQKNFFQLDKEELDQVENSWFLLKEASQDFLTSLRNLAK